MPLPGCAPGTSRLSSDRTPKGFVLLPRQWVGERAVAWLNHSRRLGKNFEATTESSVTRLYIASVKLMSR